MIFVNFSSVNEERLQGGQKKIWSHQKVFEIKIIQYKKLY